MMINKSNYEEYLVDYAEGQLTEAETREVEAFLAANPDAAAELEAFATVKLQPEPVIFSGKESLYRSEGAAGRVIKLGNILKYSAAVAAAAAIIIVLLVWDRSSQEAVPMQNVAQEQKEPAQQEPAHIVVAPEKSSQTVEGTVPQLANTTELETGKVNKNPQQQQKSNAPKNFTKQEAKTVAIPVQIAAVKPLSPEKTEILIAKNITPSIAIATNKIAEPVPAPENGGNERGLAGTLLAYFSGTVKLGNESSVTINQKTNEEIRYFTLTVDTPVLYVSQSFKSK